MRLDKFLKVSRLIKRRTLAKQLADQGRVTVNGREAKSSSKVGSGDELTIAFGNRTVTVRIERIAEAARKEEAEQLYTLLKEEVSTNASANE